MMHRSEWRDNAIDLTKLHAIMANHAGEVADLFKSEHGVKVTILARNPRVDDGDIVVTDDSIDAAIGALQRLKSKEERKLTPADALKAVIG
jgi:hypothetical protein